MVCRVESAKEGDLAHCWLGLKVLLSLLFLSGPWVVDVALLVRW